MALAKNPRCMYSRSITLGYQLAGQDPQTLPRTRLPNSQHEVALEDQWNALVVVALPRLRVAKASDLERCRNGEPAQLAVKLENGAVRRRLRTERLIVYLVHALGSKAMLPPVDCGAYECVWPPA